jgi:hypothetical protein
MILYFLYSIDYEVYLCLFFMIFVRFLPTYIILSGLYVPIVHVVFLTLCPVRIPVNSARLEGRP